VKVSLNIYYAVHNVRLHRKHSVMLFQGKSCNMALTVVALGRRERFVLKYFRILLKVNIWKSTVFT